MANDAQLLRQFVEGSQEAFHELARRHLALVYSSALRRANGNTAVAQDATQAVFLLLAKKAPHLCHHTSVAGWLYGCAQLKITEALRAERRRRVREHTAYLMHELSTDTTSASWEQIRPVLDHAMLGLNGPDREAVLLRFFEGLPFPDIASRLLLTDSAARKRVERALEKLRQNLARKGITSSASALAAVLGTHTALAAPAGLSSAVTSAAAVTLVSAPSHWLVSFIALMTTTQKIAAVAVMVTLLATGGALYQRQIARQLNSEQNNLEHQLAALRIGFPKREAPAKPPVPSSGTTTAQPTLPGTSAQALTTAIEAEQMRLFLADEWANLAGGALPLIEKLGLSADQVARYTTMAERELDGTYLPGLGALQRHQAALRSRWQSETIEIIGEDQFQRLVQLQAAKAAVQRVAGYLAFWDNGFTGQQANQMLQLFAANEPLIKIAGGTLSDALLGQARQILSSDQISLWRRYDGLADIQRQLTEKWRAKDGTASQSHPGVER
jgi:RNA polymerase sigma factor (sigma-70 family)